MHTLLRSRYSQDDEEKVSVETVFHSFVIAGFVFKTANVRSEATVLLNSIHFISRTKEITEAYT
jgi:hypothetical protein